MKFVLSGFCFVAFFLVGADKPMENKADKEKEEKVKKEIEKKLAQKITVDFEPTPLLDAIGYLKERYDIDIVIDEKAFEKQLEIPDARNQQVKLRKVKDVPLGEVLKRLVHQIGGTFQIQKNQVKVVPNTM